MPPGRSASRVDRSYFTASGKSLPLGYSRWFKSRDAERPGGITTRSVVTRLTFGSEAMWVVS